MPQSEWDIAIVGASCRLPGANNLAEYWRLIESGDSAITRVPDDRFDRTLYFNSERGLIGTSYTELGGIVQETPFDHASWPIPDDLKNSSDGVHLRMLEVCGEAFRHAGYDSFGMQGSRSGVYIGHSGGGYLGGDIIYGTLAREVAEYLKDDRRFGDLDREVRERAVAEVVASVHRQSPYRTPDGGPNLGAHDVALLVNRAFGLDGPAVAVDAACASSLVAVAQACMALRLGYIDLAIAGGCSFSKWYSLVLFSQAQSVSSTGSRPFDRNADGLISSDGYAAVVLKTVERAIADSDRILGVIRSFSVTSDGRGKSLWAPRREGQIVAVKRAYHGELCPSTLQYMECHATSTQVGDETEISALAEAIRGSLPNGKRIPIGSVKANVGHTLECAGIAGMLKVILAMQHGVIPPQANLDELNPEIPWSDVPFYVPTKSQPWPETGRAERRRAAVNAFGIGGLNTHFVIDQQPSPRQSSTRPTSSVRTSEFAKTSLAKSSAAADISREPIAIIGMGVVLPGANSVAEFWDLLKSGKSAISEVPADRWKPELYFDSADQPGHTGTKLGGFIRGYEFDWRKHKVPPKQIANSNPLQYMLLDAAEQTFRDAGYHERSFERSRTSAVVGTIFDGDFGCQMQMGLRLPALQREFRRALEMQGLPSSKIDGLIQRFREFVLEKMPALLDETGSFTSSTLASRLTKTFDLMGGAWAIDTSDISSLGAIQASADLLHTRMSDMVLCAAGQRSMDVTIYEAMRLQGFLAKDGLYPPFNAVQEGFVPGEGVAIILLKRLSDAQRDGDRIRAVIRGLSISSSAKDSRGDLSRTIIRNLRRASSDDLSLSEGNCQVEVVETARAMRPSADAAEIDGLSQFLADPSPGHPTFLSSVSSQMGHLRGASGMVSLVKSVLEIEHGEITPVCGVTGSCESLRQTKDRFELPIHCQSLSPAKETRPLRILVSNMSANGLVAHLALEGIVPVSPKLVPAPPRKSETSRPVASQPQPTAFVVARFAASTMTQLQEQIVRAKDCAESLSTALRRTSGFLPKDRCRLAIVGIDERDVQRKLSVACGGFSDPTRRHVLADNGVFVGKVPARGGRLAVVFSGQGAQYTGMLKDWAEASSAVQSQIRRMDQALAYQGVPTFEALAWDAKSELGVDVLNTQLAVLAADFAAWAALQELGIHPDVIAGHSFGEFPALVAAGAWSFEAAVRGTLFRTQAVEACGIREAAMLSTSAAATSVRDLIAKHRLACDIACYNAPDQTIIAGTVRDLDVLKAAFQDIGAASREIRVPRPYHSRLMRPAQPLLAESLRAIPLARPRIDFVSSTSLKQIASPIELREALVAQLTEPVKYQELVEQLVRNGVTAIVECGPKQILTRLNRQILRDVPVFHGCVDARPGHVEEQSLRLRLMLECAGIESRTTTADTVAPAIKVGTESATVITLEANKHKMVAHAIALGEIVWADATETRRQMMREASSTKGRGVATATVPRSSSHHDSETVPADGHGGNGKTRKFSTTLAHRETSFGDHEVAPEKNTATTSVIDDHRRGPSPANRWDGEHNGQSHAAPPNGEDITPAASPFGDQETQGASPEMLRDKLEAFVLDFVVDQTGQPPELVELDANLEADLGVDDLRKARLLRKTAEQFELTQPANSDASISLDDFPTLGTIVDFFVKVGTGESTARPHRSNGVRQSVAATKSAPAKGSTVDRASIAKFAVNFVIDQTGYPEELVTTDVSLEADLGIDSIRKAQLIGEIAERFGLAHLASAMIEKSLDDFPTLDAIIDFFSAPSLVETNRVLQAASVRESRSATVEQVRPSVESAASAPLPQSSVPRIDRHEMEQFVIEFVIEETGYPRELIDLSASLEADLGIDSIRKARLFGELAERFQIEGLRSIVADISLDDFPTLGAIVEFFVGLGNENTAAAIEDHPTNPTRKRGETLQEIPNSKSVEAPALADASGLPSSSKIDRQELEKFCIAYIIEQTGYPEELIEMDASLEADLGIDSIRKAQLFGEIAEHFDVKNAVSATGMTSLDDFPSLASIVSFFCRIGGVAPVEKSATPPVVNHVSAATVVKVEKRQQSLVAEAARVMRRYILRSVSEPLPANESRSWPLSGTALIVGAGSLASSLRAHLEAQGNSVEVLATGNGWRHAVDELNRLWAKGSIQHLFLLTSSQTPTSDSWSETCSRELYVPYFVCQRWIQLRSEAGPDATTRLSALCAITRLGGDFGLSRRIGNVSGAALTGLLKGIRREYPDLLVKVIDTPDNEPDRLIVEALHRELLGKDATLEVGCLHGQRQRLRMVPQPASSLATRRDDLAGVWVITGGARGITARIARELGQRDGVKLHVLGRSPIPDVPADWRCLDAAGLEELKHRVMREAAAAHRRPMDAWKETEQALELDRSLRDFQQVGLDVTYHSCDVQDRESVAQVLVAVRTKHGPIRGVIHGAGLEAAARFQRKQAESVIATIETKVAGAVWLWELTAQDPVRDFVAFGSTSGRFGGTGQTDYSMASDLLCRLCSQFAAQRRDCRVVGIHWPPWDEVGMAARPESQFALRASGLTFLKPAEGISHLIDELGVQSHEIEVAFVDAVWDVPRSEIDWDHQMVERSRQFAGALVKAPLLRTIVDGSPRGVTVECDCDPTADAWLRDHQYEGVPVVPGAFLLEMCLEASRLLTDFRAAVVVEGFEIQHGVRFYTDAIRRLKVTATRHADASVECQISGEFTDTKNRIVEQNRQYASARIVPLATGEMAPANDPPPRHWQELRLATDPLQFDDREVGTVYHGRSLSALRGIAGESRTEAWFRISLEGCGSVMTESEWSASPGIIDAALQACDVLMHRTQGTSQLPSRFDRLRVTGDLQDTVAAHVRQISENNEGSTWNVSLVDQRGHVLAELRNVLFARVRNHGPAIAKPREVKSKRPLLRAAHITKTEVGVDARVVLDPNRDRFLTDHRMRSKPLLPIVIALELMAEVAETLCEGAERPIAIRSVQVHSGVRFADAQPREMLVRCRRRGELVEVELLDGSNLKRAAMTGTVVLGSVAPKLEAPELEQPSLYFDFTYPDSTVMEHGAALRTLRKICLKRERGWAILQSAAEKLVESADWILDPAIFDGALMACGTDAFFMMECQTEIPAAFDEIMIGAFASENSQYTALLKFRGKQANGCLYDFTIYDAANRPFLEVRGYAGKRVQQSSTGSSE